MKEEVKKILKKATKKEAKVERPLDENNGDFSTNLAMEMRVNPDEIISKIEESDLFEVKAKNGFINFYFSDKYFREKLKDVFKKDFGSSNLGKGKKIQVEFVSANPTGPLTVGNARGGPFGDTLANVLKKVGYKVEKAYYVNDCGKQIEALGHSVLKDEEAVYKGKYIDEIKVRGVDVFDTGQKSAHFIIDNFIKKTLEKANIKYDKWYYESKLQKETETALKGLKKFSYEKDGAKWFRSSQFGDERDRVIVKSDGNKTYLAGDLGLHNYKFKTFDKVINIWGADHFGDVPGLMNGVEALGHKGKLEIILLQFVTLIKQGEKVKISKRKGNVVEFRELLEEVGVDATRFFFLQRSNNTHVNFDLDLAKERSDKNPVYYVQYALVRTLSILRKTKQKSSLKNLDLLKKDSEMRLVKQLLRYPEIIEQTANDYQTQRLPKYAMDIASSFHSFYAGCKVLSEDKELTGARLALTEATKLVLKDILDIMGISQPEKM